MDVFGTLLGGGSLMAGVPGPFDDYWYNPVGVQTASGQRVDDQGAQMLSAWYRGRMILASVLAMLPLQVYRRLPNDGGAEVATDHPLYDVIHDQPNESQDSYQWRMEAMFDIIDHGWAYSWIVPGPRGFAHQLCRIDPTLVTPKQLYAVLPNGARVPSRWVFDVRDPQTHQTKTFTQDEIFYLRGAGGKGILEYARSSLGTALSTESYAANIFSKGTLNGGVIENPGVLNTDAARRMALSFATQVGEWHLPKILEQGSKFVPNDMTPEDAQMLLSRKYNVDDIARWLGVPRLMLENSDPSFGNAEQFTQNFIDINMGGWLALWEFGINGQLILARRVYFAQFKRQAFTRANFKDRVEGHVALVNAGIETVDEARDVEDMPKRGGKADELRDPQNITGKPTAATPTDPTPAPKKPAAMKAEASEERIRAIVTESASRLLRKETLSAQKAATTHAADAPAFEAWATDFYERHVALVAQSLQLTDATAWLYCDSQRDELIAGGMAAAEAWTTDYLVGLALDAPRPDPRDQLLQSLAAKPTADVHVSSPVTIERGAMSIAAAPAPNISMQAPQIHFDDGAIRHDSYLMVPTSASSAVSKVVTRDANGQIASVTEEHTVTPVKAAAAVVVEKRVARNPKGQIQAVTETRTGKGD